MKAYLDGQGVPANGTNFSTRVMDVTHYIACVAAQARLVTGNTQLATTLKAWLLPQLEEALDVQKLLKTARQQQRSRRAEQLDALMPQYRNLLQVVMARAQIFQDLHHAVTEKLSSFQGDPLFFSFPLIDGSAQLNFRLVSVFDLDSEARGKAATTRRWSGLEGQVLLEYLGAEDAQGQLLLDRPFFVELYRLWYDLKARRGRMLAESGCVKSDFVWGLPGLLNPPSQVGRFCHHHFQWTLAAGGVPQTLLHVDAFCTGMAYGTLIVLLALSSGMRIHELQQICLDGMTGQGRSAPPMPPFGVGADGALHCVVYPKGRKRDRRSPVTHILPPELQVYWRHLVQMHDLVWPSWHKVAPQNAAELGLDTGIYLFQTGSTALPQVEMRRLARAVGFGLPLVGTSGKYVSLSMHLLRHGYAHARMNLNHELTAIQAALGHQDIKMTRYYTKGTAMRPSQRPQSSVILSLWDALKFSLPEAT